MQVKAPVAKIVPIPAPARRPAVLSHAGFILAG
jgi:hypothetical protein